MSREWFIVRVIFLYYHEINYLKCALVVSHLSEGEMATRDYKCMAYYSRKCEDYICLFKLKVGNYW